MKFLIPFFVFTLLLLLTPGATQSQSVRFATFNASFNQCRDNRANPCLAGGLDQLFENGDFRQGQQVAELIQRIRPDILLLNEFNFDPTGNALQLFTDNFLEVGQNFSRHPDGPSEPTEYPYRYFAPSNTGIHSGFDLDNNGTVDASVGDSSYADDAFGFGQFPGRYGMAFLSKYPIADDQIRTFQNFLWKDMPDAFLPDDLQTAKLNDWYSDEELEVFRLSSKSHWDIPVEINGNVIHVLASHPTPPVFDGSEDRNGRRNHDEIRLWADYISTDGNEYLVDDHGNRGGLPTGASFVIMGDLNADPNRGDSLRRAANQLLEHPRVNTDLTPLTSTGSDITSSFDLRVDYVLPSTDIEMTNAEIFSPPNRDPLLRLRSASDHRMVWVDIQVPEPGMGPLSLIFVLCGYRNRQREPLS